MRLHRRLIWWLTTNKQCGWCKRYSRKWPWARATSHGICMVCAEALYIKEFVARRRTGSDKSQRTEGDEGEV